MLTFAPYRRGPTLYSIAPGCFCVLHVLKVIVFSDFESFFEKRILGVDLPHQYQLSWDAVSLDYVT